MRKDAEDAAIAEVGRDVRDIDIVVGTTHETEQAALPAGICHGGGAKKRG